MQITIIVNCEEVSGMKKPLKCFCRWTKGWCGCNGFALEECACAQSYPTLCDTMDCSSPGSSVYVIFQIRTLEWVAISFSRRSSQPRDQTRVSRRFFELPRQSPYPVNVNSPNGINPRWGWRCHSLCFYLKVLQTRNVLLMMYPPSANLGPHNSALTLQQANDTEY